VFRTVALPTWAWLGALTVKSVMTWRWTATHQLSNMKLDAKSLNFRSKPEPEVVSAAILVSESAQCLETAQKRRQNVEIAVPRERASTDVQFGVLVPDRK